MKLNKIENLVKEVLTNYKDSRSDDFVLIYRVYQSINENVVIRQPFYEVMLNHKEYGLPAFSGITRARRKIFKDNPELANEKVQEARINKEAEYIDYAIGGYSSRFMEFVDSQK